MKGYITGSDYEALASLPDLEYERWLEDRDEVGRRAWDRDKAYNRRLALLANVRVRAEEDPSTVHATRAWSALRDDEAPLCGRPIAGVWGRRTVYYAKPRADGRLCPDCDAALRREGQ